MKKNYLILSIVSLIVISGLLSSELNNDRKLLELSRIFHEKYSNSKKEAMNIAKEKGWTIRADKEGEYLIELMGISKNGIPVYNITNNINAARTSQTDELWTGGDTGLDLSGEGFLIGEWDGGLVRTTHQEFDDGVGGSWVTQRDTADTHWHSTHVGGTIIAEGQVEAAHGMAFKAELFSWDWYDDLAEMADAAANDDLILSNHSYSFIRGWERILGIWYWYGDTSIDTNEDYQFGFYGEDAEDWDDLAYNAPEYLIIKAAGNERDDYHDGWHWAWNGTDWDFSNDTRDPDGDYDCVGNVGVAKNLLTVGSCLEIPAGYSAPEDVICSDFSSWGPCDDGRIKPDIVADGESLYSTGDAHDAEYFSIGGTSMSAPTVTGSSALIQEHYENLNGSYMLAATLKGLIIHTADEAGPNDGPDYMFGWGLLNSKTAVDLITHDNSIMDGCIYENNLENSTIQEYYFYCDGTENIKATICWTDPAGTPVVATLDPDDVMLVNDLDMRIFDSFGTIYFPWSCDPDNPANAATQNGDNNVDNIEQVFIGNPDEGYYTLQISHKGNIAPEQDYSLIFSGIERTEPGNGSDLEITDVVWTDSDPYVCDEITATVTVYNNGNIDISAGSDIFLDLYYDLAAPPSLHEIGDQYELIDTGIPAGGFIEVQFDITHDIAETWNTYLQIDTDDNVVELNESNNIWGPDAVFWQLLPVIDNLTVQIIEGNIELNWTYPIIVDHYNIYKSADPHDFNGAVVEISFGNIYIEPFFEDMLFYRVTAVRDCTPVVLIQENDNKSNNKKNKRIERRK